jgi:hypothetical protein
MAEQIFQWAGMILVYIIAFIIAGVVLITVFEKLECYFDRVIYRIESNAVRQLAGKILRDSYWFSEDPATMRLLQLMGEELADRASYDVSQLRDAWRNSRQLDSRMREALNE